MRYLVKLLICFACSGLMAQTDSTENKDRRRPAYRFMNKANYVQIEADLYGLSNQLSLKQISDLTQDAFLDNSEKDELLNSFSSDLRYGYQRSFSFTYRNPPRVSLEQMRTGQGFRLTNKYIQSTTLDMNTLSLLFYGNKKFEEQQLNFGPSKFQKWYYTSLDYLFDIRLDTLQAAEISVGFVLGHDHQSYDIRSSTLYTAKDGEYLDANLNYSLRDQSRESILLNGLGLSLGFNTEWNIGAKGALQVSVAELGVLFWNKGYILDVDSSFRFTGAGFSNILDINDSVTSNFGPQYRSAFLFEEEGDYLTLLPFQLKTEFSIHRNRVLQELRVGVDYQYLPGYFPRVYLGLGFYTSRILFLNIEASSGGYNLYRLDAGFNLRMGQNWELVANAYNLTQMILASQPGGGGAYLRLRYRI